MERRVKIVLKRCKIKFFEVILFRLRLSKIINGIE